MIKKVCTFLSVCITISLCNIFFVNAAEKNNIIDAFAVKELSENVQLEGSDSEEVYYISGDYKYKINEDGRTITLVSYSGNGYGDLIVPDTVDGYKVTVIGDKL